MKLEPVFLLAPKLPAGSVPTRRAFLCAGAAFFGGAVLGTACGYSLGAASPTNSGPNDPAQLGAPIEPPKTGNAELDDLRRLAVVAPIEELVARSRYFLMARDITYRDDDVLWRGVARLANEALTNQALSRRAEIAGFTAGSIDKGNPPPALRLKDLLPELKRISR
jgi:hypothetical protein